MKNPIFVPHGIAVLAKQKGFDEECLAGYSVAEELVHIQHLQPSVVKTTETDFNKFNLTGAFVQTSAPTYFQLMNWLREHRYEVTIHTESNVNEIGGYYYQIYSPMSWPVHRVYGYPDDPGHWDYFKTCNEALAAALSALPDKHKL